MVSTVLPIQESAQELILEATNALQPHFAEMTLPGGSACLRSSTSKGEPWWHWRG